MASPLEIAKDNIVVPKVTTTERNALTAVNGMLVYDTTLNAFYKFENGAWSAFAGLGYTAENTANKTDTMAGNTGSSTKYLSAKGVYDWVLSLGYITTAALSGYLTSAAAAATYQVILTAANFGSFITGLTAKTSPVFADSLTIADSDASNVAKKLSLTDFWKKFNRSHHQVYSVIFDFESPYVGSTDFNNGCIIFSRSGGGNFKAGTGDASRMGVQQCCSSLSGVAVVGGSITQMLLGNGEIYYEAHIKVDNLSNSTDRYKINAGLFDVLGPIVDGVWVTYTDNENSGKFVLNSSNNSVTSTSNGTTTVATGTNYRVGILINDTATSAQMYINGAAEGSAITTNIPTASGRELGMRVGLQKTSGSTERILEVDYIALNKIFYTAR